RAGHGLVNENGLFRLEHRLNLFQMRSAIDALQQDHVHFLQQFVDGIDNGNVILFAQLLGEALDAVAALLQVGAAARKRGYYADASQIALGVGAIEQLGERDHVRRVQADDAGLERRVGRRDRAGKNKQSAESGKEEAVHGGSLVGVRGEVRRVCTR